MQRTIRITLSPTEEQGAILRETLRQSSECFHCVAAYGWEKQEKNGVELHKATYYSLKSQYPQMPSQLLCAARVKATEALKSAFALQKQNRKTSCPNGEQVPIRYDARSFRLRLQEQTVSLASVQGRQIVSYTTYPRLLTMLERAVGFDSADLCLHQGKWYLHLVVTLPDVPFVLNGEAIGVDLGLKRPAVTSNKQFLGKRRWREIQNRYFRLRRKLQSKGTKAAKRHLKRVSGGLSRFRKDCDHVLSGQIVASCTPGMTIVVENLTTIRSRTKQKGRQSRRRLHSWTFAQLRGFLEYKAEAAGCQVVGVDPRHTSQRCCQCGFTHRSNRKSQAVFLCKQCGYELNADLNGSINIARKYLDTLGKPECVGLASESLLSPSALSASVVSAPKKATDEAGGREAQRVTSPQDLYGGI